MASKSSKKSLGRGLSALLAEVPKAEEESKKTAQKADQFVPIELVSANPDQPRKFFNEKDLAELTSSIQAHGIIQPLVLRPDPEREGQYQIVAGERRWRAAQRAALHEVPAVIRDLSDGDVLELAIIENIQRSDLSPVEEAQGYRQLMDRFGHTQEVIASSLGKSRSHIANMLRLLSLPELVQSMVNTGEISAGHARTLVGAEDPLKIAQHIVEKGLSVRQAENFAKQSKSDKPKKSGESAEKDADTRALEADLSAQLGLSVAIAHVESSGKGEIKIKYKDLNDLDKICQLLNS